MSNRIHTFLSKLFVKERVSQGNKKQDRLLSALLIIGLLLLLWQIVLYRRTIIPLKIPLLLWLIPGIPLTPILYRTLNQADGMKAHWILHYIAHTWMTGSILLFAFMASNYYLADSTVVQEQFEILEKGSLPGGKHHRHERKPYVMIDYHGFEKQIIFTYPKTSEVEQASLIQVSVRKGLWGFDILQEYSLQ